MKFRLKLNCSCSPQVCKHAGPGIAKLLEAAYAKGKADGERAAIQGVRKAAAKAGIKIDLKRTPPPGAPAPSRTSRKATPLDPPRPRQVAFSRQPTMGARYGG